MIKKHAVFYALLTFVLMFSSCATQQDLGETTKINDEKLLMATLYNYYAAEYKALAHQAFNIGKERLTEIRANEPENKNLAVVVDIDETILNNSPYEAKMMLENQPYSSESWTGWCNLAVAEPVPGALEFLQYADSLNFQVFYITNRKKKYVQESTLKNVSDLGFPQATPDHFLLREDTSDKETRRERVSENYEIVLLAGDNLGDFYEDTKDFTEREQLMQEHKEDFGKKFLVLPNAMYGTWVSSIGLPGNEHTVDSLLRVMAKSYIK